MFSERHDNSDALSVQLSRPRPVDLGKVDLNLLVALDALLHESNISAAARRVGMSQPAMSRALVRMRATFDDELLARVGYRYSPTPFAERLKEPLHELLLSLERTVRLRPSFEPARDGRLFRIGATDATEFTLIKPLLDRLETDAPQVRIELVFFAGPVTWRTVETGELDLCVCVLDHYTGSLRREELYQDRSVCAVWSQNDEVGDFLSPEQFTSLPHAAYDWPGYDDGGHDYLERQLLDDVLVRVATGHHVSRLMLLRGTRLVAFTFEKLANSLAAAADIRIVEPPFPVRVAQQGMLWHPRNDDEPAHAWLREQLADIASAL